MDTASAIEDYTVTYDPAVPGFAVSAGGAVTSFNLLWESGPGSNFSIGETLGYDTEADDIGGVLGPYGSDAKPMAMTMFSVAIDNSNNMMDFVEVDALGNPTTLQASVPSGTYGSVSGLEKAVEKAMVDASAASGNSVTYDISYNELTHRFDISSSGGAPLNELQLLWAGGVNQGCSIGATLGYGAVDNSGGTAYSGTVDPSWISFDSTNNVIDFRETGKNGTLSKELSIEIPNGDYSDLNLVASEIQMALRDASPNQVQYTVSYDDVNGFMIKGNSPDIKGFDLLWNSGRGSDLSAAGKLGFDETRDDVIRFSESDREVVNIVIDSSNNKIDFKELTKANKDADVETLTASVAQKSYTSYESLGLEVEKALEKESLANGNKINYSVTWDSYTEKFTIKENGTSLEDFQLLWQSGENAPVSQGGSGESIGSLLGFSPADDSFAPIRSEREVEWGIFDTLIDMKSYLNDNDTDGLERTLLRLETHFDKMSSRIADTGIKYNRLDVRDKITTEVNLSLMERRSTIEDADMIESVMQLKAIETSYQAALSSTAKMLSVSLVDYL